MGATMLNSDIYPNPYRLYVVFIIVLIFNIGIWVYARPHQAVWANVPPVPAGERVAFSGLGDAQLSYRIMGVLLQNIGSHGGQSHSLRTYDYNMIEKWLFALDRLDRQSNFVPYLAAFYFGSIQDPERIRHLLDYLEMVGMRPDGEKWRWLAHAVFLARFRMNDLDRALELAQKLADHPREDIPIWTDQMEVFVLTASGEKEAAYDLMLAIIESRKGTLHPNEINASVAYICEQLLSPEEAKTHPLCSE